MRLSGSPPRARSTPTIDQLKAAGCSEDEIFEVTVAAALGAALRSLDAGLQAVRGQAIPPAQRGREP